MRYSLVQTAPPVTEPVTLAEAKAQARIDADLTDEDTLLTAYIEAARQQAENETGRQLITATWVYRAEAFPACASIEVPKPPLLTVTSLAYVDSAGVTQTWSSSNYRVDTSSDPGRVHLAYGVSWPSVRAQFDAVQLTYTAGYGATAASVPEPLRLAILLLASEWFQHREPTTEREYKALPYAVERLVWPYRTASVLVG